MWRKRLSGLSLSPKSHVMQLKHGGKRAALICCVRGEHGSNQIMMKDQQYFVGQDIVILTGTWPFQSSKIGRRAVSCSSTQQGYASWGAAGELAQHGCTLLSHFQQVPQKPDGRSVHWPVSSCEPRRWKRGADRREWLSSAPRDTGAFFWLWMKEKHSETSKALHSNRYHWALLMPQRFI